MEKQVSIKKRKKMSKRKKKQLIALAIFLFVNWIITPARFAWFPSQMPDIIFKEFIDYSQIARSHEPQYGMAYYDKKGNYYLTKDPYVCSLSNEELVKEFREGKLDDKIECRASWNVFSLFINHNVVCWLSANRLLDIVSLEISYAVATERVTWYGLYYDKFGNVKSLAFHRKDEHLDQWANDFRANILYRWYETTGKRSVSEMRH